MKRGIFLAGVLTLFFPAFLSADSEKPVVQVSPFIIEGLKVEEGRIIETLIYSYISAIGEVYDTSDLANEAFPASVDGQIPEPQEPSFRRERSPIWGEGSSLPDYTFQASVLQERDNRVLILEIGRPRTGELNTLTSIHRTTGELVLKVRSIVESAFSGDPGPVRAAEAERLSEGGISGAWRGDAGIEMVRLNQNGRGTAIFSSGAQMNLRYFIENNCLTVIQSSQNTERFYHPIPYAVARELAAEADPMRWELWLFENGTVLRGIKVATGVRYEGNRILEILPGIAREAEWTKLGR
jgi:hypothetical protein